MTLAMPSSIHTDRPPPHPNNKQLPTLSPGFQALLRDMLAPSAPKRPTAAEVARRAQALLGSAMVASGGAGALSAAASASGAAGKEGAAGAAGAAAAVVAAGAAEHHHHHHHHLPAGAVPPGGSNGKAGGKAACALPHCQAQQKRIRDLEEMVLSLTGLRG